MKPQKLPEGMQDAWQTWPTLQTLQRDSGLKLYALRQLLEDVPGYRCPDASVRYDPKLAAAAFDAATDQAWDDGVNSTFAGESSGAANDNAIPHNASRMAVDFSLLLRQALGLLADCRKEKGELMTLMRQPIELGLSMMKAANDVSSARLTHLEGMWDKMIEHTEVVLSTRREHERADKKLEQRGSMQKQSLQFLKESFPVLMSKWQTDGASKKAFDLFSSLPPELLTLVEESGVLTPEQLALLQQLKSAMAARAAAAAAQQGAANDNANKAAANGDKNGAN